MEASRLRARAFSFSAAVFSSTMACSQLRGTPWPLMYISANSTGASGLPFAVAFQSHAAVAAASLAFLAFAISSAPAELSLLAASSLPLPAAAGFAVAPPAAVVGCEVVEASGAFGGVESEVVPAALVGCAAPL